MIGGAHQVPVVLDDYNKRHGTTYTTDTLILATLLEPEWKDYEMPLKSILEDPWGLAVKLGAWRAAGRRH